MTNEEPVFLICCLLKDGQKINITVNKEQLPKALKAIEEDKIFWFTPNEEDGAIHIIRDSLMALQVIKAVVDEKAPAVETLTQDPPPSNQKPPC